MQIEIQAQVQVHTTWFILCKLTFVFANRLQFCTCSGVAAVKFLRLMTRFHYLTSRKVTKVLTVVVTNMCHPDTSLVPAGYRPSMYQQCCVSL